MSVHGAGAQEEGAEGDPSCPALGSLWRDEKKGELWTFVRNAGQERYG